MEKHVKNYFEHHGYTTADFIPCFVCGSNAIDIHHIEPRSHFGSKKRHERDHHTNLVALCRMHHDEAHGPNCIAIREDFKERIKNLKK